MDGHETFRRAVTRLTESSAQAAAAAGLELDDIDLFVYHQANGRILRAVGERLGLDPARVVDCIGARQHVGGDGPARALRGAPRATASPRRARAARRLRRGLHLGRDRRRVGERMSVAVPTGDRDAVAPTPQERGCALVTGGSRGIGAAIARALAADGWPVAVDYRSGAGHAAAVADQIDAAGGRASRSPPTSPTRPPPSRSSPAPRTRSAPVLALVNNAGVRADGLAPQLSDEDWQSVLDTNLTAAFRLTRRALRPMLRARFGRIVNVASVVGPRANPGQANYAASKAGLIAMTKTVAAEVARAA